MSMTATEPLFFLSSHDNEHHQAWFGGPVSADSLEELMEHEMIFDNEQLEYYV